ncbi:helicase associated domain-containing protein [Kitasatospora sp. NPDC101235]|uniref:helicase associated domain-containing protein n=1 Tax=Kitasatospora sp. NPDC101235 TaxID=3364101 RepID=UPI003816C3A8
MFEGEELGRWVQAQRAGWSGLEADRQDLLAAIGIPPAAPTGSCDELAYDLAADVVTGSAVAEGLPELSMGERITLVATMDASVQDGGAAGEQARAAGRVQQAGQARRAIR